MTHGPFWAASFTRTRVPLLFAFPHYAAIAPHQPGDFAGQQLVPQLPAQAIGDKLRDFGATAPVFAFDG